jgi:adenosylcobinamide kinase / adenosylcobinamide-phosphate guanylyltransferase
MKKFSFIIGGARSGKSIYAEQLAAQSSGRVLYIATAQPLDDEMEKRIATHRGKRPAAWETLELPTEVGKRLLAAHPQTDMILVDCLTLLVSNLVLQAAPDIDHPDEQAARTLVEAEINDLLNAIESIPAEWIIVSNEVGQGLVPPYPMGRVYRDLLGWANQRLAQQADEVVWMVAGIPVPVGKYRKD